VFEINSSKSQSLQMISNGKNSSRPVHSDWRSRSFDELIIRGGNTLLLDPSSLGDWSNMAPLILRYTGQEGRLSLGSLLSENRK